MKKMTFFAAVAVLLCWLISYNAVAAQLLVPVGQVIGLSVSDDSVTVAALDDTVNVARNAGLKAGDQILTIDNQAVHNAQQVRQAVDRCDGTLQLTVLRQGRRKKLTLTPKITDQGPRLGVYLREGVTGVGTVTWYDPDTGKFGALGHGINSSNGSLVSMRQGTAYSASVMSVKKGKVGAPGQLMGTVNGAQALGELYKNAPQGIFGYTKVPFFGIEMPVAEQGEIQTGKATIRSTVAGTGVREYSVEILKIYPNSKAEGRNLLLKITDPELLNATGGIVQGMSGSPIIQNGKLVGAVTHVLVNDPTTGYGIFIENMLDAAA